MSFLNKKKSPLLNKGILQEFWIYDHLEWTIRDATGLNLKWGGGDG